MSLAVFSKRTPVRRGRFNYFFDYGISIFMDKIFISYSHKDEEWKDRLVTHLKVLELEGYYQVWEDRQIEIGNNWLPEIETALNEVGVVIMMISAEFLVSDFIRSTEVPKIMERREREGIWVIPVIVKPCPWKSVKWLSAIQAFPRDGKDLMSMPGSEAEEQLAALAEAIGKRIKKKSTHHPSQRVSLSKLPTPAGEFIGREKELKWLDDAWKSPSTHMVILEAWGGVGKTALVNKWLMHMATNNYHGAEKVYGWSFYSQGTAEGKQASADEFMQQTLKWFNDPNPTEGAAYEKGKRLASLVRQQKTLLILDGLEPLQHPSGRMGQLKDQGLQALLKELGYSQPGLCIVTTRLDVKELAHMHHSTVRHISLENLSTEAGEELLRKLGVKGTSKELQETSGEFSGHALALTLLGNYLAAVHKGEIRKKALIPHLTEDEEQGEHARRVMESYETWFGNCLEKDILYMMGLFDRPAPGGAIAALREAPVIEGVTSNLQNLSHAKWQFAVKRLRKLGLLGCQDPDKPDDLDCHPLVRHHFGEKLESRNPEAWKASHARLYFYYKDIPEKEFPDTLKEMESLLAAVTHGCQAGRHQETFDKVYWSRICRESEHYIRHNLNAFGADLASLSNFFETPWSEPITGLRNDQKGLILNFAGYSLRAQGRLREALIPMKAALVLKTEQEDWELAASAASNLSGLMLTLGEVQQAVDVARESVVYAELSMDWRWKMLYRTILANALHQAGDREEAKKRFLEAENIQIQRQQEYAYLYSVQGFYFCDLLLEQGKYQEAMERAKIALEIAKQSRRLLSIGLDTLILGLACAMQVREQGTSDFTWAAAYLNQAVNRLREAGYHEYLIYGFLARAECYRLQEKYAEAWSDLKDAFEIAERDEMKLHLTDYHLEAARLCQAEGNANEAEEHLQTAAQLIEEMGYHRRDGEIEKLRR